MKDVQNELFPWMGTRRRGDEEMKTTRTQREGELQGLMLPEGETLEKAYSLLLW